MLLARPARNRKITRTKKKWILFYNDPGSLNLSVINNTPIRMSRIPEVLFKTPMNRMLLFINSRIELIHTERTRKGMARPDE